jgi:hypothetical protein
MTLNQAYSQLSDNDKSYRLLEAGYKCEKCWYCKGSAQVWDRELAVFNGAIHSGYITCGSCKGEGRIWVAPIIKLK